MLDNDIQIAISKNLSAEVGKLLQDELEELATLRKDRDQQNSVIAAQKAKVDQLTTLSLNADELACRENAVAALERTLEIREAVLAANEGHAKEKVTMMRDVVKDVFSAAWEFQ